MIQLVICVIFAFISGLLLMQGQMFPTLLFFALLLVPLMAVRPQRFFLAFIFLRGLLDLTGQWGGGFNLASLLTVLLLATCGSQLIAQPKVLSTRQKEIMGVFNRGYIGFLAVSGFSVINSISITTSAADFLRLLSVGVVFNYIVIYCAAPKELKKLVWAVLGAAVVIMAIGGYQVIFHQGRDIEGFHRVFATFTHPNVLAEYLFVIFFLLLYLFFFKKHRWSNYFFLSLAILGILFLSYHTYTRGVWIAIAGAFFLFVLMSQKVSPRVVGLLTSGAMLLLALPLLQERLSDITRTKEGGLSSWEWRLQLWRDTVGYVKEHPFVGHGLGMYQYKVGVMAHNDYLRILYETGAFGLVAYLFLWGSIAIFAWRRMRDKRFIKDHLCYRVVFCIVAGFAVMSSADNLTRSTVILIYAFVAIAFLMLHESARDNILVAGQSKGR